MILNSKSKYDLESTLYSGQSFLWDPIQDENVQIHETILSNTRYRVHQIYDQVVRMGDGWNMRGRGGKWLAWRSTCGRPDTTRVSPQGRIQVAWLPHILGGLGCPTIPE